MIIDHSKGNKLHLLNHFTWIKWLRMQGHRLPATLEVTGSNPGPGKINLIEKKPPTGFLTLKKSTSL
jgi:hypothetical protein